MASTDKTENYDLSQFVGTDRPTWLGDYNSDMEKIDAQLKANADAIEQATADGLTSVSHTADLTGNGTSGSPLGVANTIARKTDIPDTSGFATTESVTQAIASAIADRLTAGDIKPGNGINIETSGNQVTISYVGGGGSGGLTAVAHDDTLTGDGTTTKPLGAAAGSMINPFGQNGVVDANQLNDGLTLVSYNTVNLPTEQGNARGFIISHHGGLNSPRIVQLFVNGSDSTGGQIFARGGIDTNFDEWTKFATENDVSALTSRIATLESQVTALTAAATPSTTGLTATQLDTQYSDDYNIVRVGTPTRNMETEESSQ